MDELIEKFIQEIKQEVPIKNTINQYSSNWAYNEITSNNLSIYMKNIAVIKPEILLVGEAPGYKGCKLTGIPFTSEKLLRQQTKNSIIGINKGYKVNNEAELQSEISASIIWGAFENYNFYPLLWNAFPFHPHKIGNENSNRKPIDEEVKIGVKYINKLVELYDIKIIYAIGNVAQKTLLKMGRNVDKIRHPSMGGKKDFLQGINKLCIENFI